MPIFVELLKSRADRLLKIFYRYGLEFDSPQGSLANVAEKLRLNPTQLLCGIGFNPRIRSLDDIHYVLGFSSYDTLAEARNRAFVEDAYRRMSIKQVAAIYSVVAKQRRTLEVMQYLLRKRLRKIEQTIEDTVSAQLIAHYKREVRLIYRLGVAQIAFAEDRLNETGSGFRAMVNEVNLIIDAKLIPVGDIFFRETVLPQEKRQILNRGLIPEDLVHTRLEDKAISLQERTVIEDYLARN